MAVYENLPDPQLAIVRQHISTTWGHHGCPMCGFRQFNIAGYATLSLSNAPGQMVLGGKGLPCAAVICMTCGNTILVNLFVAGVTVGPVG